jgi:uncharacterized membrane protein
MKRCPVCATAYEDESLSFCLQDGERLLTPGETSNVTDAKTTAYPDARETGASPVYTTSSPTELLSNAAVQDMRYPSPNTVPLNPQPHPGSAAPSLTSLGIDANVAALLSYLVMLAGGLIFFFLEKDNRFVRFHALQSVLFVGAWIVVAMVLQMLGFMLSIMGLDLFRLLLIPIQLLLFLGFFAVWVACMWKAFQGQMFRLPILASIVDNAIGK